ncbi:formimidoylglutamate deiminase [Aeromicrobium ginsengisoli]|uniref:Formimidoylglutamate deiminase n=1 Tax=Aeromicrobium ginsengisoli TaxID=363867 RepID=A0A5M4FAY3_9ACTN|nr:formimidoylglutamate deiminase [Aeromicrobium ginsengisoli]KAA1395501.1 formimidoylglutamate deiminase [Aeromicrobium ginsengisoli]
MTTVPAFANCHSHVFHRALRGRITGADSFWTWRDQMYALAGVLDPDLLFDLARATYAEMHAAGIRSVGEFHYLHHRPDGRAYDDPNAMGEALIAAAREAGVRIALLDTCYLAAGFGLSTGSRSRAVEGVQQRFTDGDADAWAARVDDLARKHAGEYDVVIGAAIHSVRAVPRDQLATVAGAFPDAPLHVHVSEQPAENEECLAATGLTPVALLAEAGAWTPRTTAVHATHLTPDDVATLGDARSYVCFCPTTEAELADGIGPSVALRDAGARLTLGSDSNTVIDMFAEARAVEMHQRLASGVRGAWSAGQLWQAASSTGHESLGFAGGDLIEIEESVRTAGADEVLWAASAEDVLSTGSRSGAGSRTDAARDLQAAIDACWSRT